MICLHLTLKVAFGSRRGRSASDLLIDVLTLTSAVNVILVDAKVTWIIKRALRPMVLPKGRVYCMFHITLFYRFMLYNLVYQ